MRIFRSACVATAVFLLVGCEGKSDLSESKPAPNKQAALADADSGKQRQGEHDTQIVAVGCGLCQFDQQDEEGCELFVRIDDAVLPVDGVDIDALGDAHAADGLCNQIRTARAVGEVRDGRFVATNVELLPHDAGTEP